MNFQLLSQRHFVCLLVMTCSLAIVCSTFADTITFRVVALTGDPAPGTALDVDFNSFFGDPVIDGAGHSAFMARLTGPDVGDSNNDGLWSEGTGSLALLVREGNQTPGLPDGMLFATCHAGFLCPSVMNDVGDTAFLISLSDGSGSIWVHRSGSLNLVARTGTQAPGLPAGVNFAVVFGPVLNDAGQTAFSSYLEGPGVDVTNNFAVWSEGLGSVALVARLGDQAPGTPKGVVFGDGNQILSSYAVGGAGQTPIKSILSGPGVIPGSGGNAQGIWSGGPGSLELVARAGDPAPGLGEGVNFDTFSSALTTIINGAGQTAFFAKLIGPGVDSLNDGSIWSEGSGSLVMVAREGAHPPGTAEGVNYLSLIPGAMLNGAGQTAFAASLIGPGVDGANNVGVWSEGSGSLALVARKGSQAPGTAAGVTFLSIFPGPVTNATGQVAFTAWLTGEGVDGFNHFGVWAEDPDGLLTLVIREGDQIEVAPGDVRTVLKVFMTFGETFISGGEDGREINFNDAGQLAFRVIFTDGSGGIIVSSFSTPADLNEDGTVNTVDLLLLLSLWGPCIHCDKCNADLDDNCTVGVSDLLILLANWG
ncbi:MAG: hypothetical protein IH984_11945 [Planctomycetes bacterium]|nr:hypothetical protein [Planctomycetota bacterium]